MTTAVLVPKAHITVTKQRENPYGKFSSTESFHSLLSPLAETQSDDSSYTNNSRLTPTMASKGARIGNQAGSSLE
eukprot:1366932-Amphidinium_carterae.1